MNATINGGGSIGEHRGHPNKATLRSRSDLIAVADGREIALSRQRRDADCSGPQAHPHETTDTCPGPLSSALGGRQVPIRSPARLAGALFTSEKGARRWFSRKAMSRSALGLIDLPSYKERIADRHVSARTPPATAADPYQQVV